MGTKGHQWLAENEIPEGEDFDLESVVKQAKGIEYQILDNWVLEHGGKEREIRERRFRVQRNGVTIYSAKPDVVYIHKGHALIVDYKLGWATVQDARSNIQMRAGVGALVENWGKPNLCCDCELLSVTVALINPRANPKQSLAIYTGDDIKLARRESEAIATNPSTALNPGEWCRYCPARGSCQARLMAAIDTAQTVDAASLATPHLVELYERSSLAQKVIDDCKAEMKRRIRECEIDGYALQPTGATSKVTDVKEFAGRLRRAHPTIDAWAALTTSKTLVEAALKKDGYKGVCLKEAMGNLFDGIAEMKEKEPKIVKVK
jgi:hypothetical protein